MSSPYLGEIRIFSISYAPKDWAQCNGQLLSIAQNPALFSLLGITYGGDGQSTFALPNLQGRVPIHAGNGGGGSYSPGQSAGDVAVALTAAQLPAHNHAAYGTGAANSNPAPVGLLPGVFPNLAGYTTDGSQLVPLAANAVASAGLGQVHSNLQPYLVLNVCIALQGIFPPRP